MHTSGPPGRSPSPRPRLARVVFAATLLLSALLCIPDSRSDSYVPPPHDPTLHAFDPAKARSLSIQKRREYDVLFFNEMTVKDDHPTAQRYHLFRQMAYDGFEVAHVALELFDIWKAGDRFNPKAWPRLKKIAMQGDVSGKCLYALYANDLEPSLGESARRELIKEAAEAGHPRCSTAYSAYLRLEGAEQDAFVWRERAAAQGDLLAQLGQARAYASGKGAPLDLDRAECWLDEAWRSNRTAMTENRIISIRSGIREQRGQSSIRSVRYLPGTACQVPATRE